MTSGTEAMGEVTVQLEDGGRKVVGRGASTDVIEASAKAYIDGLNKLASHRAADGPSGPCSGQPGRVTSIPKNGPPPVPDVPEPFCSPNGRQDTRAAR